MVNKLIDKKVPIRGLTVFYLVGLCLLWSYFRLGLCKRSAYLCITA